MNRITDRTTAKTKTGAGTALKAALSVAALAASGALLLTACSSSPSSPSSSSSDSSGTGSGSGKPSGSVSPASSASGNDAQAMEAYRTCLSQHGVNLPAYQRPSPGAPRPSGSPGARGGGGFGGGFPGFGGATPDAATQRALDACKSLRPRFNGRGSGGSTAFKAFTSCLKDHGVVLPTPSPDASGDGGRSGYGFGALRGLNTSDPKTAQAYETCRPLLPQRPTPSGAPSPTATT